MNETERVVLQLIRYLDPVNRQEATTEAVCNALHASHDVIDRRLRRSRLVLAVLGNATQPSRYVVTAEGKAAMAKLPEVTTVPEKPPQSLRDRPSILDTHKPLRKTIERKPLERKTIPRKTIERKSLRRPE